MTHAVTPSKSDNRAQARESDSLGEKINEIVAGGDPNQCILVFNSEISATFAEEYRRFIMDCGGEIDEPFFLKD